MNINTSIYPKRPTYNHYKTNQKNNINFQGNHINTITQAIRNNKRITTEIESTIATLLGTSGKEIAQHTNKNSKPKIEFLYKLAEKYNLETFKSKDYEKHQSKKIVFEIYNSINKPTDIHTKIVQRTNYSFQQIQKFVEITNKDNNKLELANKLLSTYPEHATKTTLPFETMENFLLSTHAKQINKNYKDYEPFITLNKNKPNIVKLLETAIENGYDKNIYQKRLKIQQLFTKDGILKTLSPQEIENQYNENGVNLLQNLQQAYLGDLSAKNKTQSAQILMNIYNTTNQTNTKVRNDIISYIQNRIEINKKFEKAPIETINRIFEKIDNDKQARIFVEKTIDLNELYSISQLDEILHKANLETLNKRPDIVSYGLSTKMDIQELSDQDIKEIDKKIKKFRKDQKKYLDEIYYHPNPIMMDIHRLKTRIANYFDRISKK